MHVKVDMWRCDHGEDVDNLRFELGVERHSSMQTESRELEKDILREFKHVLCVSGGRGGRNTHTHTHTHTGP